MVDVKDIHNHEPQDGEGDENAFTQMRDLQNVSSMWAWVYPGSKKPGVPPVKYILVDEKDRPHKRYYANNILECITREQYTHMCEALPQGIIPPPQEAIVFNTIVNAMNLTLDQ